MDAVSPRQATLQSPIRDRRAPSADLPWHALSVIDAAAVLACLALQLAAVTVPLLRRVLRTVPPSAPEWAIVAACSLAPVAVVELVKLAARRAARVPRAESCHDTRSRSTTDPTTMRGGSES